MKKGKSSKKEKLYICVVCGTKKKSKKRCCGKDMMSKEKGAFSD
ncbi:MAG: hypothetical protein ABH872_02835 [Candidatus Omnitrophota bacterium]